MKAEKLGGFKASQDNTAAKFAPSVAVVRLANLTTGKKGKWVKGKKNVRN